MIRLRAIEPEDVDMMYELENDPCLWAMGCTTVPYSRNALRRFIEDTQNDIYADHQLRLIIQSSSSVVGCIDLYNVDARNLHAEVAIALLPQYRGQGVGQEAFRQLVDYATRHLGLRVLTSTTAVSNTPMRRLLSKVGFEECGRLKGWLRAADQDKQFEDAIIYQYDQP